MIHFTVLWCYRGTFSKIIIIIFDTQKNLNRESINAGNYRYHLYTYVTYCVWIFAFSEEDIFHNTHVVCVCCVCVCAENCLTNQLIWMKDILQSPLLFSLVSYKYKGILGSFVWFDFSREMSLNNRWKKKWIRMQNLH